MKSLLFTFHAYTIYCECGLSISNHGLFGEQTVTFHLKAENTQHLQSVLHSIRFIVNFLEQFAVNDTYDSLRMLCYTQVMRDHYDGITHLIQFFE